MNSVETQKRLLLIAICVCVAGNDIGNELMVYWENKRPYYHRLYTDFLLEGLIFVYKQPLHTINENQQWYKKAAS